MAVFKRAGWTELLIATLVAVAGSAQATTINHTAVNRGITNLCSDATVPIAQSSCSAQNVSGLARAIALPGAVGAQARLATGGTSQTGFEASASAEFQDVLVVDSPDVVDGTFVEIAITFTLAASRILDVNGLTAGSASGTMGLTLFARGRGVGVATDFTGPQTQVGIYDVRDGLPFDVRLVIDTFVRCLGCLGAYEIDFNAFDTGTVDLVELIDAGPGGYTVRSVMGHQYANVPEPRLASLLLAFLLLPVAGRFLGSA